MFLKPVQVFGEKEFYRHLRCSIYGATSFKTGQTEAESPWLVATQVQVNFSCFLNAQLSGI